MIRIKPENRKYYPEVDGLRALAVILVVLFHFGFGQVSGGFIGVDIFFVISGFLITRNIVQDIEKGRFTLGGFYYRRIRRLFPALLVTVMMTSVLATLLFSAEHLQRYSASAFFAIFSVSNFFFWSEAGYFDTSAAFKPLLHFWSLSVEEQFYLVWPLMLLLFYRSHRVPVIAGGLLACGLVSLLASQRLLGLDAAAVFYLTPFRIMEFSLGAVCVWIPRQRLPARMQQWLFTLAMLVTLACATAYTSNTAFPGLNSLLPCLAAAVIIVCSDCRASRLLLGNRPMVQLGLVSYSLYLVHWPLWVFYSYWKKIPVQPYQALLVLLLAVILAFLMHRYVERPFRLRGGRERLPGGRRFFAATAMAVTLLLVPAIHAWSTGGWAWRAPDRWTQGVELAEAHCDRPGDRDRRPEQFCSVEASVEGRPKMLIIGDSHAKHLLAGMRYLAARYDFNVLLWTHRGCPPLWNTYRKYPDAYAVYEETCQRAGRRWQEAIAGGKYDYVVLGGRWMNLLEPTEYGAAEIRRDFLVDRDRPVPDAENARRLFAERLAVTVSKITESGSRAVVFSQMPLLARDIAGCSERTWTPGPIENLDERCDGNISFELQKQRLQFSDDVIRGIAGNGALAVILSDIVCDVEAQSCATTIDGHGLYRDIHHLSDEGSYLLAREYEDRLMKFLELQEQN